jgi:hypothetical protein
VALVNGLTISSPLVLDGYVPIHVKPPPRLAHETADFVQAVSPAIHLIACPEFYRRLVQPSLFMSRYFQSEPLAVLFERQFE